jgi:hypothetical protein
MKQSAKGLSAIDKVTRLPLSADVVRMRIYANINSSCSKNISGYSGIAHQFFSPFKKIEGALPFAHHMLQPLPVSVKHSVRKQTSSVIYETYWRTNLLSGSK